MYDVDLEGPLAVKILNVIGVCDDSAEVKDITYFMNLCTKQNIVEKN